MTRLRLVREESGTALVLALVFLSLFGVFVATILTFVDTGVRTTLTLRDIDARHYAADGAVDGAMLYVRDEAERGRVDEPCPDFTMNAANGQNVVVECTPQPGSGEPIGGGGNNTSNTPPFAVLTLSQNSNETGLFVRNNTNPDLPYNIAGNVRSNSNVDVVSGELSIDGNLTANGPCAGTITVTGDMNCPSGSTVGDPGAGNSRYRPKATTLPPDVDLPSCTPNSTRAAVVMPPGTYRDSGALSTLMSNCDRTFLFTGVYYFDFKDAANISCGNTAGTHLWCVQNASKGFRIIGGTPDPALQDCLVEGPAGTQFIFGGDSRVSFQAGTARICAYPEASRQRIAIYAKSAPQPPTPPDETFPPVDAVLEADTITTNNGNPNFAEPANARTVDDDRATVTLKPSQEASLTFNDYAPAIPDDASVDRDTIRLAVRHREPPPEGVDELAVEITNGQGVALPTVTAGADPACNPDEMLCLTDTITTNRLAIARDDFDEPAEINGASVRLAYRARDDAGEDVTAVVDAVFFEATYTPAPEPQPTPEPFPSQGGCVTQSGLAAITGCALVTTNGDRTDVSIKGTIYAPHSAVYIKTVNRAEQILGRGVISRVLRIEVPASTNYTGTSINTPPDSGASSHTNRDVIFTARIDGEPVLRAQAKYDDAQDPPPVTVESWAVLR